MFNKDAIVIRSVSRQRSAWHAANALKEHQKWPRGGDRLLSLRRAILYPAKIHPPRFPSALTQSVRPSRRSDRRPHSASFHYQFSFAEPPQISWFQIQISDSPRPQITRHLSADPWQRVGALGSFCLLRRRNDFIWRGGIKIYNVGDGKRTCPRVSSHRGSLVDWRQKLRISFNLNLNRLCELFMCNKL